jgi:hypothetical protein
VLTLIDKTPEASMTHQQEGDLVIETIDPAALQALCGRKLARYERPATIAVVDPIPKKPGR